MQRLSVHYHEYPPGPLCHWVQCFWTLRGQAIAGAPPQRVLPDGCPELVFNFADRFRRHEPGRTPYLQPQSLLIGQMRGHIRIEPTGRVDLLGVRFTPNGAGVLARMPQTELTDTIENLDDVAGAPARELFQRLGEQADTPARLRLLHAALRRGASRRPEATRASVAVQAIRASGGTLSIERLARLSGCSPRQLERDFLRDVGLGPKLLSRITRLQEVVRRATHARAFGWARVALDCGYADQAHFIREFRAFSGANPSAFFAGEHRLAEFFAGSDADG